jgi:hypothetical protein
MGSDKTNKVWVLKAVQFVRLHKYLDRGFLIYPVEFVLKFITVTSLPSFLGYGFKGPPQKSRRTRLFMPHHASHCCANVIWGHCCTTCIQQQFDLWSHCCATTTPDHAAKMLQTDRHERGPLRCPSLTLEREEHIIYFTHHVHQRW